MATALILTLITIAVAITVYVGVKNLYLITYNAAVNYLSRPKEDTFGRNLHESFKTK